MRRKLTGSTTAGNGRATPPIASADEVIYPESDGKPVGETEAHVLEFFRLLELLRDRYRASLHVYVGADLFIYYRRGEPRYVVAPDVFVALGADREPDRHIFRLWEEKAPPTFVIEITSASTRRADLDKREIYRQIGVQEYVMFDPLGEWLNPPLQGYRLSPAGIEPLAEATEGGLISETMGLRLVAEERPRVQLPAGTVIHEGHIVWRWWLQLYDRQTGERLLTGAQRAEVAAERARIETQRAEAAAEQARIQSQRAEIETARAQAEAERAQAEAARAQAEAERAQAEAARAQTAEERARAAESRVAELERLLREARREG